MEEELCPLAMHSYELLTSSIRLLHCLTVLYRSCFERKEDQSKAVLKHKPDTNIAEHDGQLQSGEDWSESLQNFCFCEEGAIYKKGRGRLKSMCSYHRLRMRRSSGSAKSSTCTKSSLNLAQAGRAHKPLLREGRLKLAEDKKPTQLIRSARFSFNFKPAKPPESESKTKPTVLTTVVDAVPAATSSKTPAKVKDGASPRTSGSPKSGNSSSTSKETTTHPHPLFAAAASEHLFSFSSMLPKPEDSSQASSEQDFVPKFEGYRVDPVRRCRLPVKDQGAAGRSPVLVPVSDQGGAGQSPMPVPPRSETGAGAAAAAAATAASPRVDLAVERSCSQQARLDENEINVTELAAYVDNSLFLPKEMSAMAQMMYA